MFKAQVLRRSFSLFNRLPKAHIAQLAARDGYETVTIQRFRIKQPFFSTSRKIGIVALTGATYVFIRYLELEAEAREAKDGEQRKLQPNNKRQNEENGAEEMGKVVNKRQAGNEDIDDVLLFFPTGFSHQKPARFYRGTDPEWQEFRKLATNRQRVMKIREDLAGTVRGLIANSARSVARIGQIDQKRGQVWIEFRFPHGPPAEYERPGIELTEDLEWRRSTRPVRSRHHELLERVFSPVPTAALLYQDTKTRIGTLWKHFKTYLGLEEKSGPDTVQQMMRRIGIAQSSTNKSAANSTRATSNPSPNSPANNAQRPVASLQAAPPKILDFELPSSQDLTLDLVKFRETYRKKSRPYELPTPPGSFTIVALMDVHGERAKITLDIEAVYDLKHERFGAMRIKLWNFTENRQRPRGGP